MDISSLLPFLLMQNMGASGSSQGGGGTGGMGNMANMMQMMNLMNAMNGFGATNPAAGGANKNQNYARTNPTGSWDGLNQMLSPELLNMLQNLSRKQK